MKTTLLSAAGVGAAAPGPPFQRGLLPQPQRLPHPLSPVPCSIRFVPMISLFVA